MASNHFSLSTAFIVSFALIGLPVLSFWFIRRPLVSLTKTKISSATKTSKAGAEQQVNVSKAIDAPDGWFTDAKTFELERRAIFSQTWLCITHTSHFRKPGDYLSFTVADFPFFLILGKDNILRGFHNVCRHRAYNVTQKVMGSSLVLGCRYHGWSYNTKGHLTKAPQFDQVPGFKKEDNGLFQIWVRTDPNGFVFINFDAEWEVFDPPTQGLNSFAQLSHASKASSYLAFWQTEAEFNWKQANALLEQLGTKQLEVGSTSLMQTFKNFISSDSKENMIYFPSSVSALTSIGGLPLWHMTVVEPISATRSSIRRTVYTTKPDMKISGIEGIISELETEFNTVVKSLETQFQQIVGATDAIILSPHQEQLRQLIHGHVKKEREAGKRITPALPLQISSEVNSNNCGIAERLCRELDGLASVGASCFQPGTTSQSLAW